jgi:hypothetical protein
LAISCSSGSPLVLGSLDPVIGDLTGLRLGLDDVQRVPGGRCARKTQHLDRNRRTGFGDGFTLIVDQRTDLAPLFADDEDVALAERAVLHQHRRDRTAAHVELGLDHRTACRPVRVGPQF